MHSLIKEYEQSCFCIKNRIKFLTQQRNQLVKSGKKEIVDRLNLEQRIRLLYVEYAQMDEIVRHLTSYARRIDQRAKT